MKVPSNAMLCFVVFFSCAYVCQTYASTVTTDKPSVTVTPGSDEIIRQPFQGSCTKYVWCQNGVCEIFECSRTWKINVFDPVTQRCVTPNSLEGMRVRQTCESYNYLL